jgi:hypothetical protein
MPSVKDKLLKDIEEKAQKIREKRVAAASNKTIESVVFEFFRRCDEAKELGGVLTYESSVLNEAVEAMLSQLRVFDRGAKVRIEWSTSIDENGSYSETIKGVTILWSSAYYVLNKVECTMYIDVGQMLLS